MGIEGRRMLDDVNNVELACRVFLSKSENIQSPDRIQPLRICLNSLPCKHEIAQASYTELVLVL